MRRSFYGSTPIISISYSLHQPLQNRTIPLTFRNANICMCRYAFTSALSYSLFVGEWACPSRCTDPLHSHNHCKRTTRPRLAPPHLPPLSKVRCCRPIKFGRRPEGLPHHHPSPRTNPSKTALYHPLFVLQSSVCAYTILLLNYPTRFS